MEDNTIIAIDHLRKDFGLVRVIDDFSLSVERGTITAILAPSGAGKTTLLRLLAGLEQPTAGRVLVRGALPGQPAARVGLMFQEDSVFPWLTVMGNISFGLDLRMSSPRVPAQVKEDRVAAIARTLGIEHLLNAYPRTLSGGQKQRVVIGRALVLRPDVVLCDEPFSALDENTRADLRDLILFLHRTHLQTVVFITHSIEEAILLADRLIICTGPPLSIHAARKIDFSAARNRSLTDTQEFFQEKTRVKREVGTLAAIA